MKRIVSLALICAVLVVSLAVPISAAEVEVDDVFFNVLDYTYPNNGSSFNIYGSGTISCYFQMPNSRVISYVDMIVTLNPGVTGFSAQFGGPSTKINLQVVQIDGSKYRVYGSLGYASNMIYTYFTGTNLTYVIFEKFECAYQQLSQYNTDGYCEILAPGSNYSQTIHYVHTDEINSRSFPAMGGIDNNWMSLVVYTNNWKKYDYIDIRLIVETASITSIDAFMGNKVIDLQVSEITTLNWDSNRFFVSLRMDLSSVSRVGSDTPRIVVSCLTPYDGMVYVEVSSISGFVITNSGNPLFSYLRDLKTALGQWFSSLIAALSGDTSSGDQFKQDSSGLISGLDDISDTMDSVDRPSMDSINVNYSGDISDAAVLMGNLFSEVTGVWWLSRILIASVSIGLVSYILYGKE